MANPLTVAGLLKAKVVTNEQVDGLVEAVLKGRMTEEAVLTDTYVLNLSMAIRENRFATAVLRDRTTPAGAKEKAVRTAILLARAQPSRPPGEKTCDATSGTADPANQPVCDDQTVPGPDVPASWIPANAKPATVHRRWARTRPFADVSDQTLEHKLRSAALQPHVRDLVRRELAMRARPTHKK
ncbi:hypothetical protein LNAOJCKE_4979 [Methylorubrum aminovorans]|uniref:Uncharacterized protein n=2 Tax=Methylorubrum aminovorans TaxID=269069 RepID=A0ABQ4UM30_9HYPH|nr:hypothetical protein LNAOJCKE_4979 [Methylorubrum aminovorans]